ncbi:phosphinothricin acetyltransferase [Rhodovulum sp. ES.010]|uniref:GNAT family N-acetyltransferase n=1 Tax=Rhodovulum sp. ES.010 TaxID=1882821 RepID=UPI00092C2009|nr:GNAT family N-acetyltransferase [Rhodovulum sp. ES.010]SIO31468.1 phosphinothricin acetyltransferase [Rhodovulum sp. ES.010]
MTVRPAVAADAPAIAAIWNPVIRDSLVTFNPVEKTPDEVAALIETRQAAGHGFLVGLQGADVAGFAAYGQFRAGAGYAHTMEHTILLAPGARGRGLGRALMQAVEAHAAAGGAHSMIADVSAANPGGIAFHARLGYLRIARLPQVGRKAGHWLDLVLMQKRLDAAPDFPGPAG